MIGEQLYQLPGTHLTPLYTVESQDYELISMCNYDPWIGRMQGCPKRVHAQCEDTHTGSSKVKKLSFYLCQNLDLFLQVSIHILYQFKLLVKNKF